MLAHQEQFAHHGAKVVTISFATQRYWAEAWLAETQSPFPLLIDPERLAYQAYGLESSALRSWGWRNLAHYARAILRGDKLIKEKRGDTDQLGGDFLVDAAGIVRLAQPSHNPTDRPSVERLLGRMTTAQR